MTIRVFHTVRSFCRSRPGLVYGIGAGVIVVTLMTVAAYSCVGPVISPRLLRQVEGATKEELVRMLGQPSQVMDYGDWIYTRWPNRGWVEIGFDENDRVLEVNDESVFR
jgi:hypothetical protein